MGNQISETIQDGEFLYRGVVALQWDDEENRPSSAIYRDSLGVSVDRDAGRSEDDCVKALKERKEFYAICRILTSDVRDSGAIALYKPLKDNIYHSEIHDSAEKAELTRGKARKLLGKSEVI